MMITALDADPDSLDEHERNFVTKVREFGWFRTNVLPETGFLGFSYTTGFWNSVGFSELIMFGMQASAHQIFWNIYNDVKGGRKLPLRQRINDNLEAADMFLLPVDKRNYSEHLGWSRWFYGGNEFPCIQLVWPDRNNRFPWEKGFESEFEGMQPDLSSAG